MRGERDDEAAVAALNRLASLSSRSFVDLCHYDDPN
jgi:hypothetical protein